MSDPVTNVEIEDVLSSIRRLVSEDHRPAAKPETPSPATVDEAGLTADLSDKLVLTPALRVAEPAQETGEDAAETATEEPVMPAEHTAEPVDQHPDTSEIVWTESSEETGAEHTAETTPEDIENDYGDHRDTDWVVAEDAELPTSGPADLSSKIAALEAAMGKQIDEEWEEETGEEAHVDVPTTQDWEDVEAAFATPEAVAEPNVEMPSFVPDAPAPDAADETTAPVGAAASDATLDENIDVSDDTIVDEEALRDLVLEIVREELQGAMGERITRNVRKLVRREIHRILASQDFE